MPTAIIDFGDNIVKARNLGIYSTWTCNIFSGRTSEMQIQAMIYFLGTHIESKKFNGDVLTRTDGGNRTHPYHGQSSFPSPISPTKTCSTYGYRLAKGWKR
jgi:hypothetical protein